MTFSKSKRLCKEAESGRLSSQIIILDNFHDHSKENNIICRQTGHVFYTWFIKFFVGVGLTCILRMWKINHFTSFTESVRKFSKMCTVSTFILRNCSLNLHKLSVTE